MDRVSISALVLGAACASPMTLVLAQESVPETAAAPAAEPATVPVDEIAGDAAAAEPDVHAGSRFLNEIVVTAQKREENLQDVPISVSAFSAEMLDAKGVVNPTDLPLVTPGLTYASLVSYSKIYIRGVGTDAFIPSFDMSVATYVDGVYMPYASGLAQAFGAIERIEVLKGPQGTLFGRNATGGAINIITAKPSLTEAQGEASVSYGDYDDVQSKASLSVPLADSLAFSLSGLYNMRDIYYKARLYQPDKDISKAGRAKLRWAPIDDLDVLFEATKLQSQGGGSAIGANQYPKPMMQALGQGTPPPDYVTEINDPAYSSNSTTIYQVDATYVLGGLTTRAILSKQTVRAVTALDFDETPLPLVSFSHPKGFNDMKTAEVQFLSNKDSWGAEWLQLIGGYYYLESSAGYDPLQLYVGVRQIRDAFGALALQAGGDPSGGLFAQLGGLGDTLDNAFFQPILDQFGLGPSPITVVTRGIVDTKAHAGFVQGTAKITEELSLTLGGRYQWEKRSLVKSTMGAYAFPGDAEEIINFPLDSNTDTNFSPKISLDYRPADDVMFYGSYSQAFKSGSYNIVNIYTSSNFVKPETVTTFELGAKTELFDRSLRFNTAVFQNEIKNLQVQVLSLTAGGAVSMENAGKARIRGVEFDTLWQPEFAFAPGLVITAGATYLDAQYTKFKEGSGYDETTGLFFGPRAALGELAPGRDFSGNQITQTPEFTGTFGFGYTWQVPGGNLEAAGDYYYSTKFYFTAQNTEDASQKSYNVVGARISYLYEPWNARVTVFGKNLTDEKYWLYKLEDDFTTAGILQPKATYGVRLSWTF